MTNFLIRLLQDPLPTKHRQNISLNHLYTKLKKPNFKITRNFEWTFYEKKMQTFQILINIYKKSK